MTTLRQTPAAESEPRPAQPAVKLSVPVVVGTRPEAIKLVPIILALRDSECFHPVVVSTGQHHQMVAEIFEPRRDHDRRRAVGRRRPGAV